MMELTPLDVRKKKGDFRRGLRGYDPEEVDQFLELIADRLELLTRENILLRERSGQLAEALNAFRQREQAMNEALVSAQQLREEIRQQTQREATLVLKEARAEAEQLIAGARGELEREREALHKAQSHRDRFIRSYRAFLEGQLRELDAEDARRRARPTAAPLVEKRNADGA